jgi:hypothetical protein
MSMLMHRLEQPVDSSEERYALWVALSNAHRPTIKRLCLRALAVVLMGGALGGFIALKTIAFLWRLHY